MELPSSSCVEEKCRESQMVHCEVEVVGHSGVSQSSRGQPEFIGQREFKGSSRGKGIGL